MNKEIENELKKIISRVNYALDKRLKSFNLENIENYLSDINRNISEINNEYKLSNRIYKNKFNNIENRLEKMNKDILSLKITSDNGFNHKEVHQTYDELNEYEIDEISLGSIKMHNDTCTQPEKDKKVKQYGSLKNINSLEAFHMNKIDELEPVTMEKVNSFQSMDGFEYKELKKEKLIFDKEHVKKCLHYHTLKEDLKLFKMIYLDDIPKSYYSIRNIKNNYQYWLNGGMINDDDKGSYIKDTIVHNLSHLYLEINTFEDYEDDMELFIKNQDYILNMSNTKYKNKLFKEILKAIDL